jgi:hypothetical protein
MNLDELSETRDFKELLLLSDTFHFAQLVLVPINEQFHPIPRYGSPAASRKVFTKIFACRCSAVRVIPANPGQDISSGILISSRITPARLGKF